MGMGWVHEIKMALDGNKAYSTTFLSEPHPMGKLCKISFISYTMLFPPVIHNFRYKAREELSNE